MTIDIGWVAPILSLIYFVGFVYVLSLLYVFWKKFWGDHDE